MRRASLLFLVIMAVLVAVSPASASDRSVKRAWNADDAQFEEHGERVGALYRKWRRSGFDRKRRALRRELGATRDTLDGTREAVRAETASSEKGEKARYWALRSMRAFDKDLATQRRGVRACSDGRPARCDELFALAEDHRERSFRFARRAKRLFREALSA